MCYVIMKAEVKTHPYLRICTLGNMPLSSNLRTGNTMNQKTIRSKCQNCNAPIIATMHPSHSISIQCSDCGVTYDLISSRCRDCNVMRYVLLKPGQMIGDRCKGCLTNAKLHSAQEQSAISSKSNKGLSYIFDPQTLKKYPYAYWSGVLGGLIYLAINNGIFSALLLGACALLLYALTLQSADKPSGRIQKRTGPKGKRY